MSTYRLRYRNNDEDLASCNPPAAPPSLPKASNPFYNSPPVSPPASPSSIKPSGTVSPVQKTAKSATGDEFTINERAEGDAGYISDVDLNYPVEVEEHENDSIKEESESSADDFDAGITKRFESLQLQGEDAEHAPKVRQSQVSKRSLSRTFKRTHDLSVEDDPDSLDSDAMADQDLASSERRLRRRVRDPTESQNPSKTARPSELFDGQAKVLSSEEDNRHADGEASLYDNDHMSAYVRIPIPKQPNRRPDKEDTPPRTVPDTNALHKDAKSSGAPPDARWSKVFRWLVSPQALTEAKEHFEERGDEIMICRPLTEEEIRKLADRTREFKVEQLKRQDVSESGEIRNNRLVDHDDSVVPANAAEADQGKTSNKGKDAFTATTPVDMGDALTPEELGRDLAPETMLTDLAKPAVVPTLNPPFGDWTRPFTSQTDSSYLYLNRDGSYIGYFKGHDTAIVSPNELDGLRYYFFEDNVYILLGAKGSVKHIDWHGTKRSFSKTEIKWCSHPGSPEFYARLSPPLLNLITEDDPVSKNFQSSPKDIAPGKAYDGNFDQLTEGFVGCTPLSTAKSGYFAGSIEDADIRARRARETEPPITYRMETVRDRYPAGMYTKISSEENNSYFDIKTSSAASFEAIENFADMSILSDPVGYWGMLDDIESQVIDECQVKSILGDPLTWSSKAPVAPKTSNVNTSDIDHTSDNLLAIGVRNRCMRSLDGVLSAIATLRKEGFMNQGITVLVQDWRPDVIQAVTIRIADIQGISESIRHITRGDDIRTVELAHRLVTKFRPTNNFLDQNDEQSNDYESVINLLSRLLPLAVVSYSGSHCSDFDQQIWSRAVDWIPVETPGSHPQTYDSIGLKRATFACLNDFIGGPVWVFGGLWREQTSALLSITMEQFADLWGPLYAIRSSAGFERLLALQTDGGMMFMNPDKSTRSETALHWISTSPIRRDRSQLSSSSLKMSINADEELPANFQAFPPGGRLLIGHPATGSSTVTSNCNIDPAYRLSLHPNDNIGFCVNSQCTFDLEKFGQQNTFRLHAVGTRRERYLPSEYQVGFNAGQYVNVGLQKVYKKRPAVNLKAVILEYCSKPQANPARIREILQLQVGLEMSACTTNARRTTLRQVLTIAYLKERCAIEAACDSGDPSKVSAFLGDLEGTGMSETDQLILFWPLSCGIAEVLELDSRSEWFALVKDTPASACFAVLSDNCLSFVGNEGRNTIRRPCQISSQSSKDPVLQTTIEFNPQGSVKPPLKSNDKVNLGIGELHIRNENLDGQLAYYDPCHRLRKWSRRGDTVHRELLNKSRASPYLMQVCILDRPRDST